MGSTMRGFFIILVILFSIAGCREKQDVKRELRVGAVLPLSGNVAFVGEPEMAALIIAVEDIKRQFGEKVSIRLFIEDSAGDPKTAVTATNKLLNVDKVNVLFVSLSKINHAVAPIIRDRNVLHFATTTSDIGITEMTPFTFRIYENFGTEMELIAHYAQSVGINELVAARTHDYAIDQAFNVLKKKLSDRNIKLSEGALFEPGNKDFRNELMKLPVELDSNQALVFLGYGPEFPNALKVLKELNRGNGRKLGMYTFLTGAARSQGIELLQGVQFSGFAKTQEDPALSQLTDRIKKLNPQFSSTPFINYVYTYDAMMLLGKVASETEEPLTTETLTRKIIAQVKYQGVGGELLISEKRDSIIPMAMFEYVESKLVPVVSGIDDARTVGKSK